MNYARCQRAMAAPDRMPTSPSVFLCASHSHKRCDAKNYVAYTSVIINLSSLSQTKLAIIQDIIWHCRAVVYPPTIICRSTRYVNKSLQESSCKQLHRHSLTQKCILHISWFCQVSPECCPNFLCCITLPFKQCADWPLYTLPWAARISYMTQCLEYALVSCSSFFRTGVQQVKRR